MSMNAIAAAAARPPLREDQQLFIQEIASLLAPWGLPPSSGRVYGYLLLVQSAVGVDQIAADLGMSRAGAWSAARLLETFGHVRRYGSPGSKRALYAPSDDFAAPMLAQCTLLAALAKTLQRSAASTAEGDAAARLRERARFYLSVRKAMEAAIEAWNARPASSRRAAKR